jgi:hypothetical protein
LLIVSGPNEAARERRTDEPLMIVGRRIDQMAEDLLSDPLADTPVAGNFDFAPGPEKHRCAFNFRSHGIGQIVHASVPLLWTDITSSQDQI